MYIFTIAFWNYAFERAVKTVAQGALAALTASTFIPSSVDQWVQVGVISAMAGLYSILTSLTAYSATAKNEISVDADVQAVLSLLSRTAVPAPSIPVVSTIPAQGVAQSAVVEEKPTA